MWYFGDVFWFVCFMRFWVCRLVCCVLLGGVGLYSIDFVCVVANSGDFAWEGGVYGLVVVLWTFRRLGGCGFVP